MAETSRIYDHNGWYEVKDNPLSKAGIFQYNGAKIATAPDPHKIYNVLRPPEELADEECLNSFKLLPWINDHTMLGPEELNAMPADQKGIHGVIGQDVYFEGDTLYGNIKLFSESLADDIEDGKVELSCGYRCKYDWTPGVWNGQAYDARQYSIRGNHLASIDDGRMGPDVAVLDGKDVNILTFTFDAKDVIMADEPKEGTGAGAPSITDAAKLLAQLTPLFAALQALVAASAGDMPPADEPKDTDAPPAGEIAANPGVSEAATDEDDPAKKKDDGPKDTAAMDAADVKRRLGALERKDDFKSIVAQIKRRDELAKSLSEHIGTFDHSEMTELEVATYGIKKLEVSAAKGSELAFIRGYLQAAPAPRRGKLAGNASQATMDGADAKGGKLPTFMTNYIAPTTP